MRYLAIALTLLVSGCAYTPMVATLTPSTQVAESDTGNGHTVHLTVIDERPSEQIGNRGGAGFSGASITLDQDIAATIQSAVSDMLTLNGFDVVYSASDAPSSSLRIDIRGLEYETSTGFFTGGVRVTAAIRAEAQSDIESYERFYRYDHEDRVVFVPAAESNNEKINAAVNDVLTQLISDQKLLEVLAQ